MALRKFEIEYMEHRIKQTVQCIKGNIATQVNNKLKSTGLTVAKKLKLISEGKARLKDVLVLKTEQTYRTSNYIDVLCDCYEYDTTELQAKKLKFNEKLMRKQEDLELLVERESKRIQDDVIFGNIKSEDFPQALAVFAEEMSNIAKTF